MEVAVLIAAYNGEAYIGELLDSLERQTFRDFICYIHDVGSQDQTVDILRKYRDESRLSICLLDYPATGSSKANFMSMLRYVREPYVMFCDQDDVWLEDKIRVSLDRIRSIETGQRPAMVFSDLRVVDQDLNTIADSYMNYTGVDPRRQKPGQLLLCNIAPGCTMIINRPLFEKGMHIEDYIGINYHDHFFALLAACSGVIG